MRSGPQLHHRLVARTDRRGLDKEFHRRVAELAFGICSVTHAHQRLTVVACPGDGTAVRWRERLDDPVGPAFGGHQWRPRR